MIISVFDRVMKIKGKRENISCHHFLAWLFSEKTQVIAIALGSSLSALSTKTLTFCNISFITDDINMELGICVHYPKSNPYCQGRQFKMYFSRIIPLFRHRLFIFYQASYSRVLAPAFSAFVFLFLTLFSTLPNTNLISK